MNRYRFLVIVLLLAMVWMAAIAALDARVDEEGAMPDVTEFSAVNQVGLPDAALDALASFLGKAYVHADGKLPSSGPVVLSPQGWASIRDNAAVVADLATALTAGRPVVAIGVSETDLFSKLPTPGYTQVTDGAVSQGQIKVTAIRLREGGSHVMTMAVSRSFTPDQLAAAIQDLADWAEEEAVLFASGEPGIQATDPGYNWSRAPTTRTLITNNNAGYTRDYSMYYHATQSGYDYWVGKTNRYARPEVTKTRWQQCLHWTSTAYTAERNVPTTMNGPTQFSYNIGLSGSGLSFGVSGSIPQYKYQAQNDPALLRFGGFVDHHPSSPSANAAWEVDSAWRARKSAGGSLYISNQKHLVRWDAKYIFVDYEAWSGSYWVSK